MEPELDPEGKVELKRIDDQLRANTKVSIHQEMGFVVDTFTRMWRGGLRVDPADVRSYFEGKALADSTPNEIATVWDTIDHLMSRRILS